MSQQQAISRRHALMAATAAGLLPLPAVAGSHEHDEHGHAEDAHGEHGAASLSELMDGLGGGFRKLRRNAGKPEQAAQTLQLLQQMQLLAVQSKDAFPHKGADLTGDAKADFLRRYKLQMIALVDALLETEKAVLEERFGDVAPLIKEIGRLQGDGHKAFQ